MKQRNLKVFLPVLLALLLFAVDKIALLPWFQQCCTFSGSSHFFSHAMNYSFTQDEMIDRARQEGRHISMNFGSSRSLPYYLSPTPGQIERSEYLDREQKDRARQWEVVNSAFPGSSIMTAYVRLTQWLEHGAQPEVVFIEISPVGLTSRTLWFPTELKFGVPLRFALEHIGEMPWEHVRTIIGSRVFALSRFRIGSSSVDFSFFDKLVSETNQHVNHRPENVDVMQGTQVGSESGQELGYYVLVVQNSTPVMLKNYQIDPVLEEYVYLIINECKQRNIPVVFWVPPTHPLWQHALRQYVPAQTWQRMMNQIERRGGYVLDLSKSSELRCQRFIDPVHFGQGCVPEVFAHKIKFYEQNVKPNL
ncbi:MAG: DUF1574 family protein [Leptospiraceae bacterium]|nr:DUF1574 family protein [Leptospiraceae bacterium]MCB1314383.1 DUF1574 family protein [Leptospiraceae bacterium]